ncbi:MAG: D-alanyl-D-alanine carboxypeptidase [Lachnospira sp.]|nr:D-alanyl-D-alanine carboxypeptidase [Lachnospira sp.]
MHMVGRLSYNKIFRQMLVLIVAIIMATSSIMFAMSAPFCVVAKEEQSEKEAKQGINLESPSAILMEASTGQVIFEKDADKPMPPASVTKIMTLLLIFDAIGEGKLSLEDEVTVSENAASMGGSQVFLEPGEKQTVNTMIKCISMASANDACVAMAEHICGTEEAFVVKMNEMAKGLGMNNTHFINTCGLDVEGHLTTAKDIAIMSRELITKYPQIRDYSMVWMDTMTHSTRKGDTEFGLTNTNKLIKQYEWATGLKTGSTSKAGCCLSATAKKDGVELIAVILAAPNSKTRFAEAISLLNYGYSVCDIYMDDAMPQIPQVMINKGKNDSVRAEYSKTFSYMFMDKVDHSTINKELKMYDNITAPIEKGDVLGQLTYTYDGETIGVIDVIASEGVEKATYWNTLNKMLDKLLF